MSCSTRHARRETSTTRCARRSRTSAARSRRRSARRRCTRSAIASPRQAAGTRCWQRCSLRSREAELLRAAAARLASLDFYPRPVRTSKVRIVHAPWFFRLAPMRRFRGYELGPFILVRAPLEEVTEDLVTHELCHVWQLQHRPFFWLSYLRQGYRDNEFEREARLAVELTRTSA